MTSFFLHNGLPLLFAAVAIESFGIPVPGETALIAFGVLASQGHYSIVVVIAVAAAAAIIGDNLGYLLIGRWGGRRLFERWGFLRRRTAYHEAGHAIVGMLTPGADPVRKVSIIPRGSALGVTFSAPDSDRFNYLEPEIRAKI